MSNKNNSGDGCVGCAIWVLFFVLCVAFIIGGGYLIATSDMPDWLKFFLLR